MKIFKVADLHLSDKPRDDYRWGFMRRLIKLVAKERPHKLIIAGDITEEKDHHRSILVNMVVNHFAELARLTDVIVIEGNHDYKEEGAAFFQFLERIPRVQWISEPTLLKNPGWLLLPHTNDWKRAWKNIEWTDVTGVVCHQTFDTASVGFGRKAEGVPLDAIPGDLPVWSGDVHSPQKTGHITYIGSPYTVDFGDDFSSRILIWETGKKTRSFSTARWPQKRAADITQFTDLADIEFNRGDIVRVIVNVESLENWAELKGKIVQYMLEREWTPWVVEPKVARKVQKRRYRVQDQGSDGEILETYAKRMGTKPKTLLVGKTLL